MLIAAAIFVVPTACGTGKPADSKLSVSTENKKSKGAGEEASKDDCPKYKIKYECEESPSQSSDFERGIF